MWFNNDDSNVMIDLVCTIVLIKTYTDKWFTKKQLNCIYLDRYFCFQTFYVTSITIFICFLIEDLQKSTGNNGMISSR